MYPAVAKWGYRTSYDAMGLSRDPRVPDAVKRAHVAQHFLNMRFNFPPTPAYEWLKQLSLTFEAGDSFVWTSNVDGCFSRAGFDPARVYTTQGQMDKFQCARAGCGHVWNCVGQLKHIAAAVERGILTDMSRKITCTKCLSTDVRPNLRGGEWFIHRPYEPVQARLIDWLDDCVTRRLNVAVLEIGVGRNTPVVTQIPATHFASALGCAGGTVTYLRVNPGPPEPDNCNPSGNGVRFYRWRSKWSVLKTLITGLIQRRRAAIPASGGKDTLSTHSTGATPITTGTVPVAAIPASVIATSRSPPVPVETHRLQHAYTRILMSLRTPRT